MAIVGALLLAELSARWVGPEIPRVAGSEERVYIKADQLYGHGGHMDLVFLGASETAGGLLPGVVDKEVTGLSGAYNAALVGAPPSTNAIWFKRVVDPPVHPDVAVIGMLPMAASRIDVKADPAAKNVAAYQAAFDIIDPGGLGSIAWRLRQRSALIRYRTELRQPVLLFKGIGRATQDLVGDEADDAKDPANDAKGIDAETETDPKAVARNTAPTGEILDYRQASLPVTKDDVGAAIYKIFEDGTPYYSLLARLVDTLRSHGTVPVIALAPIDRKPLIAGGVDFVRLDRLATELARWGADHGVPVLDTFTSTWPSDLFHDRNHLDLAGAKRWSVEVGTWLDQLCRQHELGSACTS